MIHRIYSTLPSFKNLEFRPGLNVLLAEKSQGATSKQTRNRAGKTSLIEIIHFLMGSEAEPGNLLRTKALIDFTFCMDFDLGGSIVSVERCGASKSKLLISETRFVNRVYWKLDRLPHHYMIKKWFPIKLSEKKQITNLDWRYLLGQKMFDLESNADENGRSPTFRANFSYFVRRQLNGAFTTPEKNTTQQQIGYVQIALMFLLGLDWKIASDWQQVRDQEKTLKELKKAAGFGAFGNIIGKAADLLTQLTLAESRFKKAQDQVSQFRVLPEYHSLEIEASKLTRELNDLANANTLDIATINDLETALASEEPPSLVDLENVYQEVGIALPGIVRKRYEDVSSFHESVIRNRRDYLSGELDAAKTRIASRNQYKVSLDTRRAEVMAILKSHGALDQFSKLQGEIGRMEAEVETLRQRYEAAEKLEGTKNELEIERNRLQLRLRRDFFEQNERLNEAIVAFEEISQQLYESQGSMVIENTSNGPSFNFQMQGDRSKGIKNMQIFCFDMMLMRLCTERGIGPGFLVHDSHLFDGVDGRQVISALKVGSEIAEKVGFQYIVTMNEDDAFKEKEEGFDLNNYVLPIRLTDATEEGGLFGIRFD